MATSLGKRLRYFTLRILEVVLDLLQAIAANAQRLHAGFANPLTCPGIFGRHLRRLALKIRLGSLKLANPIDRSKTLRRDALQPVEFFRDQPLLLDQRFMLLRVAGLLLDQLLRRAGPKPIAALTRLPSAHASPTAAAP